MKLICPECRRENEVERIYCHDCGARLDRSALAKAKAKEEDPKETQRRLRSLLDGKNVRLRLRIIQSVKLILGAILVAVLVQMFRAPDLPEKTDEPAAELPPQINIELEDASMAAPGGAPLRYTEADANAYLTYRLKSKRKALSSYLQFERGVTWFEEGRARATVERSLLGFPLYTSVTFAPRIENGAVVANVLGGKIGRMPIHPAVMKYCGFFFSDVNEVLDRERKSIGKMGAIELHKEFVIIAPKPAVQP